MNRLSLEAAVGLTPCHKSARAGRRAVANSADGVAGVWSCSVCTLMNDRTKMTCEVCGAPKPNVPKEPKEPKEPNVPNVPKCNAPNAPSKPREASACHRGCGFLKHSDPKNNGGTHCCFACKRQGEHGPMCQRIPAGANAHKGTMGLLVQQPNCAWLGSGTKALCLKGAGYSFKKGKIDGCGHGICVGSAEGSCYFVMDGTWEKMALRIDHDQDLALEVNYRKMTVGTAISTWCTKGHREYACRFCLNPDMTISPKGVSSVALGVKNPTN